jgi:hypothetical protein
MESNKIDMTVLRAVFNNIFDFALEGHDGSCLEVDENLYWTLSYDERFDMVNTPRVERVGSLMDDYHFLLAAEKDKEQAVPLLLEHLAPILQYLATRLSNYK